MTPPSDPRNRPDGVHSPASRSSSGRRPPQTDPTGSCRACRTPGSPGLPAQATGPLSRRQADPHDRATRQPRSPRPGDRPHVHAGARARVHAVEPDPAPGHPSRSARADGCSGAGAGAPRAYRGNWRTDTGPEDRHTGPCGTIFTPNDPRGARGRRSSARGALKGLEGRSEGCGSGGPGHSGELGILRGELGPDTRGLFSGGLLLGGALLGDTLVLGCLRCCVLLGLAIQIGTQVRGSLPLRLAVGVLLLPPVRQLLRGGSRLLLAPDTLPALWDLALARGVADGALPPARAVRCLPNGPGVPPRCCCRLSGRPPRPAAPHRYRCRTRLRTGGTGTPPPAPGPRPRPQRSRCPCPRWSAAPPRTHAGPSGEQHGR
ncbi:hypothetical protein SAMN02787144_10784 [Streptomyces atratus]|uniref:Uncharacterized protein n=1 Tax=Streptomyces atratus TaxID=1893 RepID=A0A1K2FCG4_STRAR|nr:hypothetical protein SAMN02787144_10784 [Streptomyces atratus]